MISCPGCGGALKRLTALKRNRTCGYCGHVVHHVDPNQSQSDESTASATLLTSPSYLEIGTKITLDEQVYEVSGSVRFSSHQSYRSFERWWITPASYSEDDKKEGHWISFNGTSYRHLSAVPLELAHDAIENLSVGSSFSDENSDYMLVTENQALSIENTFGVLPSTVALEADFIRVEAVGAGRLYVIDILGKEALVLLSEPLDASRLRRYEKNAASFALGVGSSDNRNLSPNAFSANDESPVEKTRDKASAVFSCGQCGGLLESHFAASLRIVCSDCGEISDIKSAARDQNLRAAARGFYHRLATQRSEFGLGSKIRHNAVSWRVIGVQVFRGKREFSKPSAPVDNWRVAKTRDNWPVAKPLEGGDVFTLWWLLNERQEIAWIGEQGGQRFWSEPCIPDDAVLPDASLTSYFHGQWTLIWAVGEFPYRIEVDERHQTIEGNSVPKRMIIELFMNQDNEPWRIQHTTVETLDDADVLDALSDPESALEIKRLRIIKHSAILLAALFVIAIPVLWFIVPNAIEKYAFSFLMASFVCILICNVCEVAAARIGHKRAFLTADKHSES